MTRNQKRVTEEKNCEKLEALDYGDLIDKASHETAQRSREGLRLFNEALEANKVQECGKVASTPVAREPMRIVLPQRPAQLRRASAVSFPVERLL